MSKTFIFQVLIRYSFVQNRSLGVRNNEFSALFLVGCCGGKGYCKKRFCLLKRETAFWRLKGNQCQWLAQPLPMAASLPETNSKKP